MKKLFLLLFLVAIFLEGQSQFISKGIGTGTPDSSAILDIQSVTQGLLIPRTDTSLIQNPAEGLMIYNPTSTQFWYFDSQKWVALTPQDQLSWPQTFNPIYPDGTANMESVYLEIPSGSPYSVPQGKNLHLFYLRNGSVPSHRTYWSIDGLPIRGGVEGEHIIVGEGSSIQVLGNVPVIRGYGYLAPKLVQAVSVDSTPYIVPANKSFYLYHSSHWNLGQYGSGPYPLNFKLNNKTLLLQPANSYSLVHSGPLMFGEGDTIHADQPKDYMFINGFLK